MSGFIRQGHRWLSIAFTLGVLTYIGVMTTKGQPAAWVGLLALIFWLLALVSYSAQDPSWSSSGVGPSRMVSNWAGRLGAWLADASTSASACPSGGWYWPPCRPG